MYPARYVGWPVSRIVWVVMAILISICSLTGNQCNDLVKFHYISKTLHDWYCIQILLHGHLHGYHWVWIPWVSRVGGVGEKGTVTPATTPPVLSNFANCCRVPVTMASIMFGLSSKPFSNFHLVTVSTQAISLPTDLVLTTIHNWVSSVYWWYDMPKLFISWPMGVMNREKTNGPNTDPCSIPVWPDNRWFIACNRYIHISMHFNWIIEYLLHHLPDTINSVIQYISYYIIHQISECFKLRINC